jgi:hypothetical protein
VNFEPKKQLETHMRQHKNEVTLHGESGLCDNLITLIANKRSQLDRLRYDQSNYGAKIFVFERLMNKIESEYELDDIDYTSTKKYIDVIINTFTSFFPKCNIEERDDDCVKRDSDDDNGSQPVMVPKEGIVFTEGEFINNSALRKAVWHGPIDIVKNVTKKCVVLLEVW